MVLKACEVRYNVACSWRFSSRRSESGDSVGTDSSNERQKWLGGYVREGVYVIERKLGGVKFHHSTRCRTERAALAELARFEEDPVNYSPTARARDTGVRLTGELIDDFRTYQLKVKRNTVDHADACEAYLESWMEDLDGKDLRKLQLRDVHSALDKRGTARRYRVNALKAFSAWLRRVKGLLNAGNDVTTQVQVPAARPEKLTRRKVADREHVRQALAHLDGHARDVLLVLAATGMHISELRRFARGEGELLKPLRGERVAGKILIAHKSGEAHVVALGHADYVAAAARIRARRRLFSNGWLIACINAACDKAGVQRFTPGVMRHSLGTWLVEDGAPAQLVARQLGHRSERTTNRFYVDLGLTAADVRVPTLHVVEGGKDPNEKTQAG